VPYSGRPSLGEDVARIATLAARHCRLPHPNVVRQFPRAIFPTIRDQKHRGTVDEERRLLLDDNVSPRWALFWSHGIPQTHHPKGWTIAHIWAAPKDPEAYTHLANLCLMPECLGSLSDKDGPLCAYLRFHALNVYGWHPANEEKPSQPEGYEEIEWCYLPEYAHPKEFIGERMRQLNSQRVIALRRLMGIDEP